MVMEGEGLQQVVSHYGNKYPFFAEEPFRDRGKRVAGVTEPPSGDAVLPPGIPRAVRRRLHQGIQQASRHRIG